MSYTYTQDTMAPEAEAVFVPSYARRSVKTKKVKTWMVLAPIAGVLLIGGAAAMLMNSGGDNAQPLAEPEAAPMAMQPSTVTPTPLSSTPEASTPAPVVAAVAPTPAAAPVTRQAQPARRAEAVPVRRVAPTTPRVQSAPRVQAPVEPTGPQSYQAAPSVSAPVAPVASTPPAPSISVSPLN